EWPLFFTAATVSSGNFSTSSTSISHWRPILIFNEGRGILRKFLILFILVMSSATRSVVAETLDFLPAEPIFSPLIGDMRETHDSIIAQTTQSRYEGALGHTIELLQWHP